VVSFFNLSHLVKNPYLYLMMADAGPHVRVPAARDWLCPNLLKPRFRRGFFF